MEDRGADAFGFEQPDHGFHEGVVVGISDGSDGRADALEFEVFGECDGRVLRPGVGVTDQLIALDGVTFTWRCQIAIRSGVITRFTSLLVAACQAMIFWAKTSTMNDTYVNPPHVRT